MNIALYLRLSLSDGDLGRDSKDESNSIQNQRQLLRNYLAAQDGLYNPETDSVSEFVDMYNRILIQCPAHGSVEMCLK